MNVFKREPAAQPESLKVWIGLGGKDLREISGATREELVRAAFSMVREGGFTGSLSFYLAVGDGPTGRTIQSYLNASNPALAERTLRDFIALVTRA